MKGYYEIRPGMAEKGDIIKAVLCVYDDSIKTKKWDVHFVRKIEFLKIMDIPTNSGKAIVKDSRGKRFYHWYLSSEETIAIYRKA